MDKLKFYQDLTKRLLSDLVALLNRQHAALQTGVDCECVFDDERGHYLLVKVGWAGSRRIRVVTLHLRLRNEKVWIEEDMTEEGIAADLMAHGVPKEDIVLAFHSPEMRKHSEFAAV